MRGFTNDQSRLGAAAVLLQWVTCQQWLEVSEEVMNVASTDAWHNFHEMHAVLAAQAPGRVVFCQKTLRVFCLPCWWDMCSDFSHVEH